MSTTRQCDVAFKIAPGSKKYLHVEWPRRNIGAATISSVDWTVPSGTTESSSSIDGLKTTILLDATSATEGTRDWLIAKATLSTGEIIQARFGVEVSYGGQ